MKKITIILSILLINLSAYCVTTEKEVITVTYAADTSSVIGFSVNAVNYATPVTDLDEILFKADNSGRFITDEFYIYWQLYSQDRIRLTLTMNPMTYGSSILHYQVEPMYVLNSLRTDSNPSGYVINDTKDVTGFRMDSMPIALRMITTDLEIEQGDYLGSMTLMLEVI